MEETEEVIDKPKRKRKAPQKKIYVPDPIVTLNEEFSVKLDPHCLVLLKKRDANKNESEEEISDDIEENDSTFETMGFYSNWESIANAIIKNKTRNKLKFSSQNVYNLSLFIKTLQDTVKEVKEIFKDIDRLETESIKIYVQTREEKKKELGV